MRWSLRVPGDLRQHSRGIISFRGGGQSPAPGPRGCKKSSLERGDIGDDGTIRASDTGIGQPFGNFPLGRNGFDEGEAVGGDGISGSAVASSVAEA